MFMGCTSLTSVTALPATSVSDHCYQYMFYGCTNLYIYTSESAIYKYAWRIPAAGTMQQYSYHYNTFYDCPGDRGSELTILRGSFNTYYVKNEPIAKTFNIATTITNVTADPTNPTKIKQGETVVLTFTAADGYILPDQITVTNATYTWNTDLGVGTLTLSGPSDNINITITGI